jgi:bleomycin hydrolase
MRKVLIVIVAMTLIFVMTAPARAQNDTVQYIPKYYDPVLEEMEKNTDSLKSIRDSVTGAIRKHQTDVKKEQKKNKRELRFDVSGIHTPDSLGAFSRVFHFPPVAQYRTGTCWSFSSTSFIESEVYRQTGRKIKLSEMHTVYYEYLAKARRFIQERGAEWNGEGSEANALIRMMKQHGAVPLSAYSGLRPGETRHDHTALAAEIQEYLNFVKSHDYWDEDAALKHVRLILDTRLGSPPATFEFEGRTYTPTKFLSDVLKIDLNDYVDVISTLSFPYYTQGPYEVPDNWWYDSTYYNLPLDKWYSSLVTAIRSGYSAELAGDVSEPGWYGQKDMDVIPEFDIPQTSINAQSREFRFYNRTTTDDHGIHLVGCTILDGRDWFLIKDSGRSARHGRFEGYFFMRDDYLRLKMLGYTVHRDALRDVLASFPRPSQPKE